MARWCEATALISAKRTGKSTTAEEIVRRSSLPNALIFKEGINLYDEAFKGYPTVEDIYSYKGGKVLVDGGRIPYRKLLAMCYTSYRNGLLLIDDAAQYEKDVITPELRRLLIDNRKLGIEILLVYHGITQVPIEVFPYLNNIILGHTTDNFEYKINKLPNIADDLRAAKEAITETLKYCKCQGICKCGRRYTKKLIVLS